MFEKFRKQTVSKTFIITATALFLSFATVFLLYSTVLLRIFEQHSTDKSIHISEQISSKLIQIKNTAQNFLHTQFSPDLFEKYDSSFLSSVAETKSLNNYFDGVFAIRANTSYYSYPQYIDIFSDYIAKASENNFILSDEEQPWSLYTLEDGSGFITYSQQVFNKENNPIGILVFCVSTSNPTFLINDYPSAFIKNTEIRLSFDNKNSVAINSNELDCDIPFAADTEQIKKYSVLRYTLEDGARLRILTSNNYIKSKLFTLVLILFVTYAVFICLFFVILRKYIRHTEKQLDNLYIKMIYFNANPKK